MNTDNYMSIEVYPEVFIEKEIDKKDELFPNDLITHISFFLDNKTLSSSLRINKNWFNNVANGPAYQNRLWERNFRRQFESNITKPTNLNWRDFYISYEKEESKKGVQQLLDKLNKVPNGYERIYGREIFCSKTAGLGYTENEKKSSLLVNVVNRGSITIGFFLFYFVGTMLLSSEADPIDKNIRHLTEKGFPSFGAALSIFGVICTVFWTIFVLQVKRMDIAYDKTYSWHRTVKHLATHAHEVISESLGNKLEKIDIEKKNV